MPKKSPEKPAVKRGRPERDFDAKTFEGLCHIHCTVNEIELVLSTDQRVIDKWCKRHYGEDFATTYKRFEAGGKASFRRDQRHLAKKNASVAIWLGKQWLGQKDHPDEIEEFNGKLLELLDTLKNIQSEKDFKKPEIKAS